MSRETCYNGDSGLTLSEQEQVELLRRKTWQCPGCGQRKSATARLCRSCSNTRDYNERYLKWRNAVLLHDDWTCQVCGKRDGSGRALQTHHAENYKQRPHLRYIPENGITFCKRCHKGFHDRFGTWGNNWHQVNVYIEDEAWRRTSLSPSRSAT